ncbi:MAG: hypothetical protein H7Z72_25005 [Bacteroidetes bacterium]|nr:hypothetical protein [Fibrella sp.]
MFDLDPLSRPVAVVEMLLLLTFAAFVGWLLARLIVTNRINALRSAIADQEAELNDCRQATAATPDRKTRPVSAAFVGSARPASPPKTAAPLTSDSTTSDVMAADALFAPAPEHPVADPVTPRSDLVVPLMSGSSEAAVLQRIAARASELNFARIGLASAAEADDLKDIVGIGPFLERKLHSLGIYTFRQVANFAKEDVDKVNEIIEFFPGRIERDNWVDQSTMLYERKYKKPVG